MLSDGILDYIIQMCVGIVHTIFQDGLVLSIDAHTTEPSQLSALKMKIRGKKTRKQFKELSPRDMYVKHSNNLHIHTYRCQWLNHAQ